MMYEQFALIYDRVMRGVDYPGWADYVLNLAKQEGFDFSRICDLACGTGAFAIELVDRGCEVLGVDNSAEMLKEAERKTKKIGTPALSWKQADLVDFKLDEEFSLITCLYDSINYLMSSENVAACFSQVFQHTRPGGGFIFDITTEYNIIAHFADYTFAENYDNFSYIWENKYDISSKVIVSEVTIFHKDGDRFYKAVEFHRQKIYPIQQIDTLARKAGFKILRVYDGFTLNSPGAKTERVHFVCKREK